MGEPAAARFESGRRRLPSLRRRARGALPFVWGVIAALIAVLLYHLLVPGPRPLTTGDVDTSIAHALASVTPPPADAALVYQAIRPSFVLVQAQERGATGQPEQSLGSGVVIDAAGDVLTSLHVVAQATAIQLTFADGTRSPARVANAQPDHDIAVLRADQPPAQLVPATLGNPNAMNVGDEAFVVGNPFGLYDSMSAGVISGFDRTFTPAGGGQSLKGLIQFDAAVNPGNSGGPLLNRAGQVIGIVTGLANPTDQDFFVGLGFAVPIDVAGGAAGLPPY
ncbi:MAG TPA: trypsin-like peptidase domain-containing protein [Thermomicrobiales bacterium]|nr:trypsin-like peptidase domain-containing protein [Thermomicrobiales bacterium]